MVRNTSNMYTFLSNKVKQTCCQSEDRHRKAVMQTNPELDFFKTWTIQSNNCSCTIP